MIMSMQVKDAQKERVLHMSRWNAAARIDPVNNCSLCCASLPWILARQTRENPLPRILNKRILPYHSLQEYQRLANAAEGKGVSISELMMNEQTASTQVCFALMRNAILTLCASTRG